MRRSGVRCHATSQTRCIENRTIASGKLQKNAQKAEGKESGLGATHDTRSSKKRRYTTRRRRICCRDAHADVGRHVGGALTLIGMRRRSHRDVGHTDAHQARGTVGARRARERPDQH